MRFPKLRIALEVVATIFLVLSVLVGFIAIQVGWDRVPESLGTLALIFGGCIAFLGFGAVVAGIDHLSENAQSRFVRISAQIAMVPIYVAAFAFFAWFLWNFFTDWDWIYCGPAPCRYF